MLPGLLNEHVTSRQAQHDALPGNNGGRHARCAGEAIPAEDEPAPPDPGVPLRLIDVPWREIRGACPTTGGAETPFSPALRGTYAG